MERWIGKVAVITGASSGIGLAIAKVLTVQGMIIVGLARRKDVMLKEMSNVDGKGKFHAIECDVSDAKCVEESFNYIRDNFKKVHVLINNAGIVKVAKSIEDLDIEELKELMGTNIMGNLYCYKYAINLMKINGEEGHIINMNSVTGHKVPTVSHIYNKYVPINVYPATKFAMTAISETLANELRGTKIRVTNLSPGYVKTAITGTWDMSELPALKPEDIAETVIFVLGLPSHVQITQLTVKPLGEYV